MIADPLAGAIVKQFPEKFGGAPAAPAGGPAALPRTAGETIPWALYAVAVAALIGVGGFLAARGRRAS
jgi:LPXTG-motif cell wall-anchored protein